MIIPDKNQAEGGQEENESYLVRLAFIYQMMRIESIPQAISATLIADT